MINTSQLLLLDIFGKETVSQIKMFLLLEDDPSGFGLRPVHSVFT
jgi:hypothetical protein